MPQSLYSRLLQNSLIKRIVGFSFVGVGVTLFSMLLSFIVMKKIGLSAYLTYFISFLTTILLSYYLNSRLIFRSGKSLKNLVLYYATYGLSLLIGMGTLYLYRSFLHFDELILNYMVIPVTMTWNFIVSSRILKPPKQTENI